MTKQQFLEAFESALGAENVSADFTREQSALVSEKILSLSDEAFAKYANEENVNMLARSAMEEYLSRTKIPTDTAAQESEQESQDAPTITLDAAISQEEGDADAIPDEAPADKSDDIVTVDTTPVAVHKKKTDSDIDTFWKALLKKVEDKTPSLLFTILAVLSFPLILFAAFVVIGALCSIYFALAALVVAIVGAIIMIVCGGGLISIVSLLYGATQVMQAPRYVGIHEIGFALIVIGATLLSSVLLYNIAIRLIPWVLSKASVVFKVIIVQLRKLAEKAKKGCDLL
ncbi:MAG: hypothetical protein E7626_07875 [Ruminococcaceae bacterium]|nr:hypothetical protein [Oscillospiraceae bacterium]